MERAVVLYDGDCGLCRWSADTLRRWDRRGRVDLMPLQAPEADELLRGLSEEARRSSWHLVDRRRRVASGGAALPIVLRLLPGGKPLAAVAARFPRATDRAYRFVAMRRDRIGSRLGLRGCSADPRTS
jgi:predicted DCC family thiol-disulfide oxidoreductase YuxK